jgi:hypothetical protein
MTELDPQSRLAILLQGMMFGALAEAFQEMAKDLRRYAGRDFDKALNALEKRAVRSVDNAAIDGIPEHEQLFLIEKTRAIIAAAFKDAREV